MCIERGNKLCYFPQSGNSRCVIVMTNLAFAPEGRKRELYKKNRTKQSEVLQASQNS